jgi:hypothetical protein
MRWVSAGQSDRHIGIDLISPHKSLRWNTTLTAPALPDLATTHVSANFIKHSNLFINIITGTLEPLTGVELDPAFLSFLRLNDPSAFGTLVALT